MMHYHMTSLSVSSYDGFRLYKTCRDLRRQFNELILFVLLESAMIERVNSTAQTHNPILMIRI